MKIKGLVQRFWKPALAVLGAVAASYLLLAAAGYDAPVAFEALYNATFKTMRTLGNTLNRACPLLFTGIAVAFSFRGNVFNIGTEGQFLFGAIAATLVGISFTNLPGVVLIPFMMIAGAAAGMLWGLVPGYLKAKRGVSEVITTIMFNYIALQLIGYLVRGPIKDVAQAEPQSYVIAEQGFLSYLLPDTRLHIGFFLGCLFALIIYFLLFKTYFGYEVRAVGFNGTAAKCGGINVGRTMVLTMLISGGLAGLGGAIELAGNTHYLLENISPGYGFTAIAVSILASNNPIGIIFSSLLFGFLSAGSTAMQRAADVSASFVNIFQGIIIIFIAIAAVSQTKVKHAVAKGGKQE